MILKSSLLLVLLSVSVPSFAGDSLPKHQGKCGPLEKENRNFKRDKCRVGDVVVVKKADTVNICDYRYAVVRRSFDSKHPYYSCVLRALPSK